MLKIYSLLLLTVIAAKSFAECPSLAGKYSCEFEQGKPAEVIAVTQTTKDGVEVYNFGHEDIVTDNQSHELNANIKYTASCSVNDELLVTQNGNIVSDQGEVYAKVVSEQKVVGSPDTGIKFTFETKYVGLDGKVLNVQPGSLACSAVK